MRCTLGFCFIKDLFEVSYDKVNKLNLHPVELKQFWEDPPDVIHLTSSKNQKCWWHTPHAMLTLAELLQTSVTWVGRWFLKWMGNTNRCQLFSLIPWIPASENMNLLKSLSIFPTPFPNCFCLEISPRVLRGKDPVEGNGGGKDWDQAGDEQLAAAYHCCVFEELLQDLMLCTGGVTCLGKTLRISCLLWCWACCSFTVQDSSQFKGVHSNADLFWKSTEFIYLHTHLALKIFPFS